MDPFNYSVQALPRLTTVASRYVVAIEKDTFSGSGGRRELAFRSGNISKNEEVRNMVLSVSELARSITVFFDCHTGKFCASVSETIERALSRNIKLEATWFCTKWYADFRR